MCYNHPDKKKPVLLLLAIRLLKQWAPRYFSFPGSLMLGEGKDCGLLPARGVLVSQKRFHTVLIISQLPCGRNWSLDNADG